MKNPFEIPQEEPVVEYEVATGSFQCQTCYKKVNEAKYIESVNVLTWICPDGHISNIEDFE